MGKTFLILQRGKRPREGGHHPRSASWEVGDLVCVTLEFLVTTLSTNVTDSER